MEQTGSWSFAKCSHKTMKNKSLKYPFLLKKKNHLIQPLPIL